MVSFVCFPEMAHLNSYDSPDTPETDDSTEGKVLNINRRCIIKLIQFNMILIKVQIMHAFTNSFYQEKYLGVSAFTF